MRLAATLLVLAGIAGGVVLVLYGTLCVLWTEEGSTSMQHVDVTLGGHAFHAWRVGVVAIVLGLTVAVGVIRLGRRAWR